MPVPTLLLAAADAMLADYRPTLERMRRDESAWNEIGFHKSAAYHKLNDLHGYSGDPSYRNRYGVLLCLQYDRRESDRPLLRWLLEQETASRCAAPFQGESAGLYVAAYLLCCFRSVEDFWLLWKAKTANFDTICGFDAHHLFAAGIDATLSHVRNSDHPQRAKILRSLQQSGIPSSESMQGWWDTQHQAFPASIGEEDPLALTETALQLEQRQAGRLLLDAWEAQTPLTERAHNTLMYLRDALEQPDRALAAAVEILNLRNTQSQDIRHHTSARLNVIEHAARAGEFAFAWQAVEEVLSAFQAHPEMKYLGMTLSTLNAVLELGEATPSDSPLRRRALRQIHQLTQEGFSTSWVFLTKAGELARSLEEYDIQRDFDQRAEQERRRIERGNQRRANA